MSYVDTNLAQGEAVAFRASIHWAAFIGPVFWLLVGLGGWAASQQIMFLVFFGLIAILLTLSILSQEIAVTNKRVIGKEGLIRRNSIELRHDRVEAVVVNQGIFGRMLGYGMVRVRGTGGSQLGLRGIADPLRLRREVDLAGEASRPQAAAG